MRPRKDIRALSNLLLANNAEVNARATNGTTPLGNAIGKGRTEIVKLLIANKADPNLRSSNGYHQSAHCRRRRP